MDREIRGGYIRMPELRYTDKETGEPEQKARNDQQDGLWYRKSYLQERH
jgi:hypothetical protein